jgi:DNA-binding beta-propeller fold protein YncE
MKKLLSLSLLVCAAAAAQRVPLSTDLPSHPFFIKNTWFIGGTGTWDYLTFDRDANRIYIAHGTVMQVVDADSGALLGEMRDLYEARQIVLDDAGQFGYISDGGQGKVVVFDRETLKKVAEIDTGANPRWMVFDPLTHLVFVVRANPPAEAPPEPTTQRRRNTEQPPSAPAAAPNPPAPSPATPTPSADQQDSNTQSFVTVIDAQTQTALGEIKLSGLLGYAVVDDSGQVYIAEPDHNQVVRIDAQAIAAAMRPPPSSENTAPSEAQPVESAGPAAAEPSVPDASSSAAVDPKESAKSKQPFISLDWTRNHDARAFLDGHLHLFGLGPECREPRALAIDKNHLRIFAACTNRTLEVLNTGTGEKVTSLPIGPGADAVGYDPDHGLIFTSNGEAEGSMTIIRQDVTDSYNVIQTLPTRERANTLAVNPQSGAVYLVTDYQGVDLSRPGGIGTLHEKPVEGSFQVVEVGN